MVVNGKFRVLSVLAKGGMGKIYRAEQVPLGRPVAMKVLRTRYADETADDPQFQKRFFLEASILSKLQHANIVTLYDYGKIENVEPEQYFMAMEFLNGDTLAKRIKKIGNLSARDAFRTFRQIARGLREAHKLGIVHRDLKPSNIILVPDEDGGEIVKILDFGIGKILSDTDSQQELTAEGAFLGSPRYMAPEQINEGRVDSRTDIYSMGVMLYEAACGKVPYEGDTNINTMMAHCNQPLPAMSDRVPGLQVPPPLEFLARHCLEKDSGSRPPSMDAFLRELAHCEEQVFGVASVTSSGPISAADLNDFTGPNSSGPHQRRSVTGLDTFPGAVLPDGSTPPPASGGTHRTLTHSRSDVPPQSQPPAAPAQRKGSPVVLFIGGAVFLAAVAAVVVYVGFVRPGAHAATPPGTSSTVAPPTATSYTLIIDSTPSSAQVYDGDQLLGTTPLQLPIDHASVKTQPRRFVVKLDGYDPYTLLQGDSDGNVRVVAPLIRSDKTAAATTAPTDSAAPTATATGKRHGGGWTPPPPTTTAAHPPPPPPQTSEPPDIKLRR
jgi:serine/threonine-protein kinase